MSIHEIKKTDVPRSSRGRVLLREGQIWVWIGDTEGVRYSIKELYYNENDRLRVKLEPFDQVGYELERSEEFFRKWFCEEGEYIKKKNKAKVHSVSHPKNTKWVKAMASNPVLLETKKIP